MGLQSMIEQFAALQRAERSGEDIVMKALRLRDSNAGEGKTGKAHTEFWGPSLGRGYFKWLAKAGVQGPILRAFARRLEVHQAIMRTRKRQVDRLAVTARQSTISAVEYAEGR